ncbi:MAG: recombinase family protein [Promethearchaeota archaeon]
MKLSDWAKQQGVSYKTAWRLYTSGDFPLPTERLPTGTIIVHEYGLPEKKVAVLYARVSSYDQKEGLDQQMERLRNFAAAQGYQVAKEIMR